METKETEVRFLEINKDDLVKKLKGLGAEDRGEIILEEAIIYDKDAKWAKENRFVRIRKSGDKTEMTYKEHMADAKDGAREVTLKIDDLETALLFLQKVGLTPFRRQQKKRHTLILDHVTIDIDTWPRIPTYAEFEGPSLEALKTLTDKLDLSWDNVVYDDAAHVIENKYHIPVRSMKWFTFDRFE